MDAPKRRTLVLENGRVFEGFAFGGDTGPRSIGEVVFTTGMTGFTETLTDPGYAGQIVLQTFPLIGNYGVNPADFQSAAPVLHGYVVKEWCQSPSHYACMGTLDAFLCQHGIPGLWGIDTRALTKLLRTEGTLRGALADDPADISPETLRAYRIEDAVARVSTKEPVLSPASNPKCNVLVLDFGVRNSVVQALNERGCGVAIVPYDWTAAQVLAEKPDGIVLSGGPGDPRDLGGIAENIQELMRADTPLFGVGLGHQLLAMANGAGIERLKYGHRGGAPVRDNLTGRTYITAQNHGYAVKWDRPARYTNVNDGSCEGLDYGDKPMFSVQFDPDEAAYDRFISMMANLERRGA